MVYAYIIGRNFMEKEYEDAQKAFDSLKNLQRIHHEEKLFYIVSERKLDEKDAIVINAIQTIGAF